MNPQIGRFVTMDSFAGWTHDPYSLHKYLYAHANPVNNIDPSGYSTQKEAAKAGIIGILSTIQVTTMIRAIQILHIIAAAEAAPVIVVDPLKIVMTYILLWGFSELRDVVRESEHDDDDDDDDDWSCGPDTRQEAFVKAIAWASSGTEDWLEWEPMPWNQYNGRGGPNYTFVRQMGEQYYGYDDPDPDSDAQIFNHPDGHPDQVGPGYPDHHACPHYHSINRDGVERYFKYRRMT